jgi:uncharacterized protein
MPLALDDVLRPAAPGGTRQPGELHVAEPIGRFTRLAEIAANVGETLAIDLRLSYDGGDGGLPRLEGRVGGTVELACQRCLGPLRHPVALSLRLVVVPEGSELAVPLGYEAWEMPDDGGTPPRLRELIEDEVILSLPLIARHADRKDCGELSSLLDDERSAGQGDERKRGRGDHPFAVLKSLKRSD